jgi:hypothetical protein
MKHRSSVYSYERIRALLFGGAFCTSSLAFTIPLERKSFINRIVRGRPAVPSPRTISSRFFSFFDPNNNSDFESLVQAATSSSSHYPLGGDFAGLAATFNPADGSFIPIPPYLIPDSLLEWGQEPKCLEVLVSEEEFRDEDYELTGGSSMMRTTTTILPDTGCGIDNLETIKVVDEIDLESQWTSHNIEEDAVMDPGVKNVVGLQYPTGKDDNQLRVETIFGLEDESGQYRMRVAIDLVPSSTEFGIQTPMILTLERRTSSVSSGGTIAEGGGLDGRTVSMLLGERLRGSKTFVDDPPISENYGHDSIKHVALPGNVSIAYGWLMDDEWVLQVGHVGSNGMRRVLSRQFHIMDDGEMDFEIQSWVEDPQEAPVH